MPYYKCTLVDEQGHYQDHEYYAENRKEVAGRAGQPGREAGPRPAPVVQGFFAEKVFIRKIGYTEFLLFNQEMITLLKAGIPIIRALEIIIQNTRLGDPARDPRQGRRQHPQRHADLGSLQLGPDPLP